MNRTRTILSDLHTDFIFAICDFILLGRYPCAIPRFTKRKRIQSTIEFLLLWPLFLVRWLFFSIGDLESDWGVFTVLPFIEKVSFVIKLLLLWPLLVLFLIWKRKGHAVGGALGGKVE